MSRSYRRVLPAAAFLSAAALAAPGYAMSPRDRAHALVGTLQKVEGQSITVQTPKGPEAVTLVSGSRIHRGATTIQAADLSTYTGQRIKVRYVDRNGEKEAQSVTLASGAK
jgi:hypothetical protein